MTDTEKKIAEIREALEKATQGKWKYMPSIHSEFAYEVCVATFFDPIAASVIRKEDANLIANAPEWLRFLLEERNKLIEGLRWYAGDQYGSVRFSPPIPDIPILHDCGQRARDILHEIGVTVE